jgi:hypothetical protein
LIEAARYGMLYTVQRLIAAGSTIDINAKDEVIIIILNRCEVLDMNKLKAFLLKMMLSRFSFSQSS